MSYCSAQALSLALGATAGECSLGWPLLPAKFAYFGSHAVIERAVDKILGKKDFLELLIILLACKHLASLLQISLICGCAFIQEGLCRADWLAVLSLEPRMSQNLLYPLQRPNPMGRVLCQKSTDQCTHLLAGRRGLWKFRLRMQNCLKNILLFRRVEGRTTKKQLIKEDSQGIEVDLVGVSGPA